MFSLRGLILFFEILVVIFFKLRKMARKFKIGKKEKDTGERVVSIQRVDDETKELYLTNVDERLFELEEKEESDGFFLDIFTVGLSIFLIIIMIVVIMNTGQLAVSLISDLQTSGNTTSLTLNIFEGGYFSTLMFLTLPIIFISIILKVVRGVE